MKILFITQFYYPERISSTLIAESFVSQGNDVTVVTDKPNYGFNEMVRQIAEETPVLERGDKELLVLPPYPLYVLCNNVHMCLARGINIVVVPKVDYQNIHKYFMKHKITAVQGIPSTVMSMLNDKGFEDNNVDLSSIKFIVAGGGALASDTLKKANDFLHRHNCKYNRYKII